MICPKCGYDNNRRNDCCSECGFSLKERKVINKNDNNITYAELFQLLSVLTDFGLLIVAIVALFYQNKKK